MLQRFGSSIRTETAQAALLQMTQGKKTVLQYADEFESRLAQLKNYDEQFYTTKFIFGLHPAILEEFFVQRPKNILVAKEIAEVLELTHQMTKNH